MGTCATRQMNKILGPQVPYYAYQFDDVTAPFYFPKMPLFTALAYHTADIQYLFPTYHGGPAPPAVGYPPLKLNAQQTTLSNQLVGFWARFASTGNPNGVGNKPWPRFTLPVNAPAYPVGEHSDPVDLHRRAICRDPSLRRIGGVARMGRTFCPTPTAPPVSGAPRPTRPEAPKMPRLRPGVRAWPF